MTDVRAGMSFATTIPLLTSAERFRSPGIGASTLLSQGKWNSKHKYLKQSKTSFESSQVSRSQVFLVQSLTSAGNPEPADSNSTKEFSVGRSRQAREKQARGRQEYKQKEVLRISKSRMKWPTVLPASNWERPQADAFISGTDPINDYDSFFESNVDDDLKGLPASANSICDLDISDELRGALKNMQVSELQSPKLVYDQIKFLKDLATVLYYNPGIEEESRQLLITLLDAIELFDCPSIFRSVPSLHLNITGQRKPVAARPDLVIMSRPEKIIFFFVEVKVKNDAKPVTELFSATEPQALAEAFAVANFNWEYGGQPYHEDQEVQFCIQVGANFKFYKVTISYKFLHDYVLQWIEPPLEEKLVMYTYSRFLSLDLKQERREIFAALMHQKKKSTSNSQPASNSQPVSNSQPDEKQNPQDAQDH